MLRLAFLFLVLTSLPVSAADMWKKACEEDLVRAMEINLSGLDAAYDRNGKFDNRLPRKLGAAYAPCIEKLITIAEQWNWGRKEKYRQRFIAELMWVRDLLRGDMAEVHRQAKFYRDRNRGPLDKILAILLHQWAVEKKYPPAEFDEIQTLFADDPGQLAIGWLKLVAGRGYVPAMLDAARRFLKGDGVAKNLGDAYYWIKRAEAAHGDLSGIIEKPYERLLEQMNDKEKENLARSLRFYGPLE
jgi:TPR repeat protein